MPNELVQELYTELGALLEKGDNTFIEDGPVLLQSYIERDGFFDGVEPEHAEDGYTRNRVIGGGEACGEEHVIRFMEWPPGYRLMPHEHHGRPCFEVLVDGELHVTDMTAEPVDERTDRYRLEEVGTYTVHPGDAGIIDPRENEIHAVETMDRSRSLHVYPEDNASCAGYVQETDDLYRRETFSLEE